MLETSKLSLNVFIYSYDFQSYFYNRFGVEKSVE